MPVLDFTKVGASAKSTILPRDYLPNPPQLRDTSGNKACSRSSPRKVKGSGDDENASLGDNSPIKRSSSFKSFLPTKDSSRSSRKSPKKKAEKQDEQPLKKSKSSSSLSALLSRPRSSKGAKAEANAQQEKEKEKQTSSNIVEVERPPPIWAQFATTSTTEFSNATKVPLNDRRDWVEDIKTDSSRAQTFLKHRDVQGMSQPTSPAKAISKTRPKSECLGSGLSSTSLSETLSGLRRSGRNKLGPQLRQEDLEPGLNRRIGDMSDDRRYLGRNDYVVDKHGSSVLTTAAIFDKKASGLPTTPVKRPASAPLDAEAIESAFETLLETRNVPSVTRDKMRSLDANIKADFIRQDKAISYSVSSTGGLSSQDSKPATGRYVQAEETGPGDACKQSSSVSPKKSRPRSLTFTLSKVDQSPSKRQKSGSHQRTKSGDVLLSETPISSASAVQGHVLSLLNKTDKFALPEQVIAYLRKFSSPQSVEITKIQKLRQLLRNEAVGWVDAFITRGGMTEVVDLLYRIVAVEWREEHEDTILHEVLLCIKALSTTASAMIQISAIQGTLFPILLHLLFDDERKGPSEYNTRTIIISLLHSYLATSVSGSLSSRAETLLNLLRDRSPPEGARAPDFMTTIYHPRPYRTWHKELNNLTKEVFWIFLHHHNIIPYPLGPSESSKSYQERHFPKEHPPVAAAPYIGGVEWDATAYVTAHLDLINGLIASLSTKGERNQLRREMKDSGFEKLMGVSFRTCKEKFYGSVHEALSVWVGAAHEDGWPEKDIRQGPPKDETVRSPIKKGKRKDQPPKLDMPRLDLGAASEDGRETGGWL